MSDHLHDTDIHNQEVSAFMDSLRRDPRGQSLISAQEELELVARLKKNPNDQAAWDRFVLANGGLVTLVASKYRGFCVNATMGDLISVGNIGLMKAIPRYNPYHKGKRVRFTTYAVNWVVQCIGICVENNRNIFPLKQGAQHLQNLRRAALHFKSKNGWEPSVTELARALKWSESDVRLVRGYGQPAVSLEEPVRATSSTGEVLTVGDTFEDEGLNHPSHKLEKQEESDIFYAGLNRLDDRPVLILALREGLLGAPRKTLGQLGKRLSLTGERVRQCEEKARKEFRKAVDLRRKFLRVKPSEAKQGKLRLATLLAKFETERNLAASLGVAPWKIEDNEAD